MRVGNRGEIVSRFLGLGASPDSVVPLPELAADERADDRESNLRT